MIIIGEQINATRSDIKPIIENHREDKLIELAQKLADAGATYIDVNIGTGSGTRNDEVDDMRWAVKTIGDKIDIPLCLDSADAAVLEAGLEARESKPAMINSTKAEKNIWNVLCPWPTDTMLNWWPWPWTNPASQKHLKDDWQHAEK